MRKYVLILTILMTLNVAIADITVQPIATQTFINATTPQNISFENCTKIFNTNKEQLFYHTLGAISANRFNVIEIQTNNGYIIFSANRQRYLATIAGIDDKNSILKITPCNNIYYFAPGILSNMFKYIDLNLKTEVK